MFGTPDAPRLIRKLLELMEEERRALLSGDYERLPSLTRQLEKGLDQVPRTPLSAGPETRRLLARLKKTAERNRVLTEASQRGLRAAKQIASARDSGELTTYSPQGKARKLALPESSRDHRT